ncbi:metallophosphoesterase [Streptomyces scopuliridis]|uniref:Metallophosphoesterase n=1 Tax=Streptomyces scopuliridis TaxID=452529 RepID=A0ACD4ZIK8_9ACTN|nr:metallophosphoesterase [Streptomyces scopuliridis]WSB33921.1 metallophosphoesterase [Streptomyces scopuliridis]WSB98204.1 metallophosphoesterase [Streptomyces scopuliridis]WSC08094.1 metallophosphoesterase [Streptomyces scopuliridis]
MVVVIVLAALAAVSLVAAAHWYLWRRLVRDTTSPGGLARRLGTVAAVVLPLLSVGAVVSGRSGMPFWAQQVLAWPGFLWLAVLLYLLLALLVGEVIRPLLRRLLERRDASAEAEVPAEAVVRTPVGTGPGTGPGTGISDGSPDLPEPSGPAPAPTPAPSRRLFVSRVVGGAAATAALATVGYGTYGVLRGPRVKRVTVPLAKLPRAAHGFRIAVVSDIHLGPILGRAHTQRIVDTINSTQPDLIAVVGDLVDGSVENLGPAAEPLAGLKARHGSFFVTGNHEYFSGADAWVDHVRELGLRPLENERVEIPGFDLAGVNDVAGESEGAGPDFAKALDDRDRARASVLLAHQPVVIDDAVRYGVDLQLSGHTHGGQLWPGNLLAGLANPTVAGLERYGDTQLYVSRGAGAWGPPVRVGAPSDITLVELASRQA